MHETRDATAGALSTFRPGTFRPAWWLPGPHAQTVAGRLLRRPRPPRFRRERIETPDGDFVDVDVVDDGPANGPLVLLLHGLEGSSRRGYAILTYRALAAQGLRAAGLNFRGCSGEANRTARLYHSGETEDLRFVLGALERRTGAPVHAAIGFSLGGNVLLKYLAEEGDAARLRAAVAVSVPYDLGAGADVLDGSFMGRFYSRVFLKSLVAKAEAKAPIAGERMDLIRGRAARSFRTFDDAVTAPLHGFAGAHDYYSRSSSGPLLERVRVPTLLVHAADDPFLPPHSIPRTAARDNPFLRLLLTDAGGHVGFIGGQPWSPEFWVEREVSRYLAAALAR